MCDAQTMPPLLWPSARWLLARPPSVPAATGFNKLPLQIVEFFIFSCAGSSNNAWQEDQKNRTASAAASEEDQQENRFK